MAGLVPFDPNDTELTPEELAAQAQMLAPEDVYASDLVNPNTGVPNSISPLTNPRDQLQGLLNDPAKIARIEEMYNLSKKSIDEQAKGIAQNEDYLKKYEQKGPDINWAPVTSLVDNWTGSNFTQSYKQPETEDQRNQKILALKNAIQGQKSGLTDKQIQLLKAQSDTSMLRLAATDQRQQDRLDYREHQSVINKIDNDKLNTQRIGNYSNLSNALTNFTNADVRDPSALAELEQTIRSSLGTKGTGGVDERDKTFLKTFQRSLLEAQRYWSSNPTDTAGIQSTIDHLKQLAANEQENFRKQVSARWKSIIAGHNDVYSRHPEWFSDLQNKITISGSQLAPPNIIEKPRDQSGHVIKTKKPSSSNVGDVNADLTNMTDEELKAWTKKHGG